MFGSFLQKGFDGFALRHAHARPSAASAVFSASSAVGLRYRMQSLSTMA
jgi:hypothetical protein